MEIELQHADTSEARRYNKLSRRLTFADIGIGLALIAVLLATNATGFLRDVAFRLAGGANYVLALFFYTTALLILSKVVNFPLDFYGFRLEHQYHLSNQRFRAWLWDEVKSFLLSFALAHVAVQIVYLLIRKLPQSWWIVGWALFLFFSVVLAQIAPVVLFPIFFKFRKLHDDELTSRLTRLTEKAGARVRGVYEWMLSEKSKKANAALMGLGTTRRIVIADTLLSNYTHDEIEAVLAHELGHHVHRHILKSIVVQALITFLGFWVLKLVLRWSVMDWGRFISQFDFANLPLVILVTTAISILLMPLLNAYSRYNERQADRYAWKSIASIEPFCTAMDKLATQNLAEREPSRWVELLFHSHPSISRRIEAAQRWVSMK